MAFPAPEAEAPEGAYDEAGSLPDAGDDEEREEGSDQ